MVECSYELLTLLVNFELVNWELEQGYCDCSFEGITSSISLFGSYVINSIWIPKTGRKIWELREITRKTWGILSLLECHSPVFVPYSFILFFLSLFVCLLLLYFFWNSMFLFLKCWYLSSFLPVNRADIWCTSRTRRFPRTFHSTRRYNSKFNIRNIPGLPWYRSGNSRLWHKER